VVVLLVRNRVIRADVRSAIRSVDGRLLNRLGLFDLLRILIVLGITLPPLNWSLFVNLWLLAKVEDRGELLDSARRSFWPLVARAEVEQSLRERFVVRFDVCYYRLGR